MYLHLAPKILVIQGERQRLDEVADFLSRFGCEIESAECGNDGIDRACNESVDLVFIDAQLPDVDGYMATQTIRDREIHLNRHVPIVAMMRELAPETGERCLDAGMDDYIAEPLTSEQVWVALNRWLPPKFPRLKYAED